MKPLVPAKRGQRNKAVATLHQQPVRGARYGRPIAPTTATARSSLGSIAEDI